MGTAYAVTQTSANVYLFTTAGALSTSNPSGVGASGTVVVTDAGGVATLNDSSGNAQLTVTSLGNNTFSLTVTSANPVTINYTHPAATVNPVISAPPLAYIGASGTTIWQSYWAEASFTITLPSGAVLTGIPKLPAGAAFTVVGGVGGIRG